jgi:Glycosyltransferase like family 2
MIERSITVCAYNRPHYLHQVLHSLRVALGHCAEWHGSSVFIGVDPGGDNEIEVRAVAERFAALHQRRTEVIVWDRHLGVSENPRRLLQHVFIERQSEFNVHLEDDTVLSPDALSLAEWYRLKQKAFEIRLDGTSALFLALHSRSHNDHPQQPDLVHLRPDFCPWGWCCTYLSWWLWFSHWWNCKREIKLGFDWSASYMMHKHGLWGLEPSLSRVTNIGRELGEHQTPEEFDIDMAGLVAAGYEHTCSPGEFRMDSHTPVEEMKRPPWTWGS